MRLNDKVALITGAGSGIGQATALLFAREGARVLVADRTEAAARKTAEMAEGGKVMPVRADVTQSDEVQTMIDTCLRRFGRIDILCNIAGIGSTQNVVETPEELWEQVFAVNARGVFLCCKYAIPHMVEAGGGAIVNMASVAGQIGIPNRAAYCAAKGAVILLTKSIAVDYVKQGIRCNCVCPGTVDSPWVARLVSNTSDPVAARTALEARQPMGRLGTPDEIAQAVLYLASDDAAFITGSELVIDGGWTAQ